MDCVTTGSVYGVVGVRYEVYRCCGNILWLIMDHILIWINVLLL